MRPEVCQPCYTFKVMATAILFGLGVQELGLILIIVMVLFGATKVPQLMRGLGQGIKEFKTAVNDDDDSKGKNELPDKESSENSE